MGDGLRAHVAAPPVADAVGPPSGRPGGHPAEHVVAEAEEGASVFLRLDHELGGEAVAVQEVALRTPRPGLVTLLDELDAGSTSPISQRSAAPAGASGSNGTSSSCASRSRVCPAG